MPESLQQVASAWLHRAEHVAVHASAAISKSVTQVVQVCAEHKKPAKLVRPGWDGRAHGGAGFPVGLRPCSGARIAVVCRASTGCSQSRVPPSTTTPHQTCGLPGLQAKHLQKIQEASKGLRNPPRVLIFANRWPHARFN